MTPEKAAQSLKRARDKFNRELSDAHERYRRSQYRIQSQCEHIWEPRSRPGKGWVCTACMAQADKKPST